MNAWLALPVVIAAGFAASAVAGREIQRRIQPVRLELARRGEELLLRDDLPADIRRDVEFMLETAFGMGWVLLLGLIVLTPAASIVLVFSKRLRASLERSVLSREQSTDYKEIDGLHSSVMLANNPVMVPLMMVWVAIWAGPALYIASRIHRSVKSTVDGSAVMRFVEQRTFAHAT